MDLFYDLGGLLTSPRTTFKIMKAEERGLGYSVVVLCLFTAATATSVSTAFFYGVAMPYIGKLASIISYFMSLSAPVIAALAVIAEIIRWLFEGAISYALVKAFKGNANYEGLLLVLGYSKVCRAPMIVLALTSLLIEGITVLALIIIGFVISVVLGVIIEAIGISETQSLSTSASVAVVILMLVIELVIILGIVFIGISPLSMARW